MYNISVGFAVCWGVGYLMRYILRDTMRNTNFATVFQATAAWALIGVQVIVLGGFWLTIPPLLIGLLFEAIFDAPLRTPINETPRYPFVQCWALGLVMLKVWTRYAYNREYYFILNSMASSQLLGTLIQIGFCLYISDKYRSYSHHFLP
jgi:hypothetical protein